MRAFNNSLIHNSLIHSSLIIHQFVICIKYSNSRGEDESGQSRWSHLGDITTVWAEGLPNPKYLLRLEKLWVVTPNCQNLLVQDLDLKVSTEVKIV